MAALPGISEFYAGRCVFITGATGFMGKVLIERLLHACPKIGTIYLMVRAKKGVDPIDRIAAILDCKLFEPLSQQQPDFREKLIPIVGDITDEELGICPADRDLLIRDVSIIFHLAATVNFDTELKLAIQINMAGVLRVLDLARQLPRLEALVHASTAYANCDQQTIEERVYPTGLEPRQLIAAMDWMDSDLVDLVSPKLIQPRPNTYTYTKAMAERILQEEAKDLPVAIARPSIVSPTLRDPFPGWVDSFSGAIGLCVAVAKGALRTVVGNRDGAVDFIPCDSAINFFIAIAWETALLKPKEMRVYNCTTEGLNPIYWRMIEEIGPTYYKKVPFDGLVRLPRFRFTSSRLRRNLSLYMDNYLPAWLMDQRARMAGGKPKFLRLLKRMRKSMDLLEYFTTREWHWTNDNLLALHDKLSPQDQTEFDFDVRKIDWDVHQYNCYLGIKFYLLKESMEDLPREKNRVARLQRRDQMINIILTVIVVAVLSVFIWYLLNIIF